MEGRVGGTRGAEASVSTGSGKGGTKDGLEAEHQMAECGPIVRVGRERVVMKADEAAKKAG